MDGAALVSGSWVRSGFPVLLKLILNSKSPQVN